MSTFVLYIKDFFKELIKTISFWFAVVLSSVLIFFPQVRNAFYFPWVVIILLIISFVNANFNMYKKFIMKLDQKIISNIIEDLNTIWS